MKRVHRTMEDYKDILHMPHHVSQTRPHMPVADRAAQFSPFAGVVGHEAAIQEKARYTEEKKELDEMEKVIIDERLRELEARLSEEPEVTLVYFEPDPAKDGGQYRTKTSTLRKLDGYKREVEFHDGVVVSVDDIYSVDTVK